MVQIIDYSVQCIVRGSRLQRSTRSGIFPKDAVCCSISARIESQAGDRVFARRRMGPLWCRYLHDTNTAITMNIEIRDTAEESSVCRCRCRCRCSAALCVCASQTSTTKWCARCPRRWASQPSPSTTASRPNIRIRRRSTTARRLSATWWPTRANGASIRVASLSSVRCACLLCSRDSRDAYTALQSLQ